MSPPPEHRVPGVVGGRPATRETFARAAEIALRGAVPRRDNAFKVELAKRTAVRALMLSAGAPS